MKKIKNKVVLFTIWTYLCFWAGLMGTGLVMYTGAPEMVVKGLSIVCAWIPSFVFLTIFPRILPEEKSRWGYIKKLFVGKHIGKTAIIVVLLQSVVFFVSVLLTGVFTNQNWSALFECNVLLFIYAIIYTFINGATGEELGWRGFIHFELTEKYGIIKGSIIVGILWSFWHLPLWFITTGYHGVTLLFYIVAFLVSNISASVIIGILLNETQNLLLPVIVHYLFNFWVMFYLGDFALLLVILAVFYFIGAFGLAIWYQHKVKKAKKENIWKIK